MVEIVTVDRTDIIEAQFLEQGAAGRHAAGEFVGLARGGVQRAGQLARQFLQRIADAEEFAARHDARQIGGQATDRRRDRHVIVVENDDQTVARLFGVVHRLIGHARRHRAVADHGDALARRAGDLVGNRKAQRRRDRGRAVRRTERVVFALRPLGEARQPAALAQRADAIAAAGQDLVRIALVTDVPHQPVGGRVEHIMDRDGQFDNAEARSEMPAGRTDRADRFLSQFVGELPQIFRSQLAKVGGRLNGVEQRGAKWIGHRACLAQAEPTVDCRYAQGPTNSARPSVQVQFCAQSAQVPRTSMTGRTGLNPAPDAAARTVPVILSSSICVVCPHWSQTRKMQSWTQSGWVFAR